LAAGVGGPAAIREAVGAVQAADLGPVSAVRCSAVAWAVDSARQVAPL
jgi:hypothetical protein